MSISRRPRTLAACALAAAAAASLALAACSTSSSGGSGSINSNTGAFGSVPAASGTPQAGTITWAEPPGAAPTWILPVVPGADFTVYVTNSFNYELWRPLYWTQNGVSPTINQALSLADYADVLQRRQDGHDPAEDQLQVVRRPAGDLQGRAVLHRRGARRRQGERRQLGQLLPGPRDPGPGDRGQHAERDHARADPEQGGQPAVVHREHARAGPAHAGPRLGQGLGHRPGPGLHQPGEREADLRLPGQGLGLHGHLRDEPALAGRGRSVPADRVQQHHRRLHHGPEPQLRRADVEDRPDPVGGSVHLRHRRVQRRAVAQHRHRLHAPGRRAADRQGQGGRVPRVRLPQLGLHHRELQLRRQDR